MDFYELLVIVGIGLEIACIVIVLFFEHKNPPSTIAWILVLFMLPVVGIIAYMFLGSGFHVNKRKRYSIKLAVDEFFNDYLSKELCLSDFYRQMDLTHDFGRMSRYFFSAGRSIYTEGNCATVFTDGTEKFDALLADMENAKHHIHLLYYIFRHDALGEKILEVAKRKAREGVVVRLLYDNVGNLLLPTYSFSDLQEAGGNCSSFAPMRFSLMSQLRANYRNHRKIAVIDGSIGYVGGMNVGVEYLGEDKHLTPWRDTHMRLTGPSVWFLQERFLMDWFYATDEGIKDYSISKYFHSEFPACEEGLGVQIVSSGPDTTETAPIKGGMMEMLYTAKKNVYLQTPYFAPDGSLFDALQVASMSGIDVRVMIPLIGDHRIVHWATLHYAREALAAGIRVFLYKGFLHSKTIVCDGKVASIGTANISNRSFYLNFEVNAFVFNEGFALEQEEIFHQDMEDCIEINEAWFASKPMPALAMYKAARLIAPLM